MHLYVWFRTDKIEQVKIILGMHSGQYPPDISGARGPYECDQDKTPYIGAPSEELSGATDWNFWDTWLTNEEDVLLLVSKIHPVVTDIYLGNSVVGDCVTEYSDACRFKGFTPPPLSSLDLQIVEGAFQVASFVNDMAEKVESFKGEQERLDKSFIGRITKRLLKA